ncbi:MAG: DUF4355 domain-containing protein [Clostridia bacterium]|nr:DUF4355 domain-containing protein [Clostridia bacterium]
MSEIKRATLQAGKRNAEGHGQKLLQKNMNELPKTMEELKAVIQIEGDRRVTQALKTAGMKWRHKFLGKLAAERNEAERLANLTAENKVKEVLEKYRAVLEEKERAIKNKELEIKIMGFLSENKLPLELKGFVISQDEETSLNRAEELCRIWNRRMQEHIVPAEGEIICKKGFSPS